MPYSLSSLNIQTMNSINSSRIKGLVQQSPSIVPVYNPGYQLVTMQFNPEIQMQDQTMYYLDIEKYNDLHDKQ